MKLPRESWLRKPIEDEPRPPAPPVPPRRAVVRLTLAAALGYAAALPYLLPLFRQLLVQSAGARTAPPLAVVVVAQGAQMCLLVAGCAWVGAKTTPALGLSAPWLLAERGRRDRRGPGLAAIAIEAAAVGSVTAMLVAGVLHALHGAVPPQLTAEPVASFWRGASSALYGALVEETLVRWGVLAGVAWLLRRALPLPRALLVATVLAALIFGAAHLPAVAALHLRWSAAIVAWVLLGNGLAGIAFGQLFIRRGLEAAMIAHAAADLWLHAALPVLLA